VRRRHVVGRARGRKELGRVLEGLQTVVSDLTAIDVTPARTSQTPRRRMKKLSGKRLYSIWLRMKTFEVRALSSMMGMFEV
jgi:hypothetical protein